MNKPITTIPLKRGWVLDLDTLQDGFIRTTDPRVRVRFRIISGLLMPEYPDSIPESVRKLAARKLKLHG